MEKIEIPDFVLKRLGLEVSMNQLLKNQLAEKDVIEERAFILEVALRMSLGCLEVGDEGIDLEVMNRASAEIDRIKTSSPEPPLLDPASSPPPTDPSEP